MKTTKLATVVAALVVSMAAVLPTRAATYTQSHGFSGIPNYFTPLTFSKFNVPGATLNSIKVTCNLNISGGQLIVDNDGAGPATVTVGLGAYGNLSSTDVTLKDASNHAIPPQVNCSTGSTFNLGADNGDGPLNVDPNPPDGATHNGGPASNSKSGFVGSAYFSHYIGSGTYNVNAEVSQLLYFGGIAGIEGTFTPVWSGGSVEVIYDYGPVPEPSGVLALAGGLGCLVPVLRRRRP